MSKPILVGTYILLLQCAGRADRNTDGAAAD